MLNARNPPIDEASPVSKQKFHLKKALNIPNLKLGKVEGDKKANVTSMDRNNSITQIGFRSERSIKDIEAAEAKKNNKDKPETGINFFFYKNFNKFIQNLYIQDEQQILKSKGESLKKSTEKHNSSTNLNPYKKEIDAINNKKSAFLKKPSTAHAKSSIHTNQTQIPTTTQANVKKVDLSKKQLVTMEDEKIEKQATEMILNNFLKPALANSKSQSNKLKSSTSKNADKDKFKIDQPEFKLFLTPRENTKK